MTRFLVSLAARARRTAGPAHYGRGYVFLVIALAIFLLGLTVWRRPPAGYTARVGLVQSAGGGQSDKQPGADVEALTAKLKGEILSDQAWQSLAGSSRLTVGDERLAALRQRTTVHVHAQPTGDRRIALWHAGPSAEQAIAVAQRLAERFVLAHSQQQESRRRCAQCDAAQAEVAQAATAMQQATAALEAFRRQNAADLSPTPASAPSASPPAPVNEPNPLWRELSDRLDVLRAAHAQCLQKRTDVHPEVIDLALQIEQAEAQLDATPRTLAAAPVVPPSASGFATPGSVAKPSPEIIAQRNKLTTAADVASQRHSDALAAERRAWQDRWSQPSQQIAIVEPAHIVQRHGGGPSKAGVLLVSLAAIAGGLAAAWRSQVIARPAALSSAAQVERLGLPVAAVLATRDGPAIPQPQLSNPRWIRALTIACELALAAIVALLVVVVLADWQIAAQALWDPLTAFSDAVAQLLP